ncbi:unnamed protein product [Lactuca virosa]|uniref:Uncharacterized protein n=1 Tax=Lactuca virosa TaxID=75947 RepID=A0AAU9LP88_9ASTR|nr:unnamed protein product [Lactuca virosa]
MLRENWSKVKEIVKTLIRNCEDAHEKRYVWSVIYESPNKNYYSNKSLIHGITPVAAVRFSYSVAVQRPIRFRLSSSFSF